MKRILLISTVALSMTLASCDSYLDINEDPNSPSVDNIETGMLMPAIEMNVAASYGDFLRIAGGYHAQQYAQLNGTSNYVDYSQFNMSATRSSGTYTQFTQKALLNLKTVLEKSLAEEDWGTYLAATTLRAFVYEALVDCYGEVPYTEALNSDNATPKYDDGQVVYEGVVAELDAALANASNSSPVCANFLYPSATAGRWIQFANALKLKMLMRMADVKNVQAEVAALIAEDNFPTADVSYVDCWSNEPGQMNPFYSEEFSSAWGSTQTNVAANLAIIGTMQVKDAEDNIIYQDPRLTAFFAPNSTGTYIGGISGTNYPGSTSKLQDWCRPVVNYNSPVCLISVAEVEFFIAEYYARYGTATEAAAHYAAAVEASFSSAGVAGAAEYIARYPYDQSNYKQSIGIAKWVALSGVNTFEAWCEMRRLDYPTFGTAKGSDFYSIGDEDSYNVSKYVAGTLYTPIQVFGQVGDNKILERYPYAESSSARNPNTPDFPGYTSPVFWGK
ncbi:SusD/RagB family nutrient-binding outer membrane lipoprotein [Bacteroides rodentium]|uniref:SusD/RagB family nutrient-binding outer membrane lipoprotein n=1 Tax=Bacteroides rodentium TaxID=691816 RepID=UPI0004700BB8|nr:SusD/RagB family nutrient-binding outer membrane lipoprotein [Bacteroides rodentium]